MKKLIILFVPLVSTAAFAQQEWKSWNAVNLTVSPIKILDVKLAHLRSYELANNFNNNFNQTSLQADVNITKRISVMAGAMLTQFPNSTSASTSREYARVSYKLPLGPVNITNGIQAEVHSASETRFRNRFIYIARLGLQKRLPFLKLAPSVSYWLYYNKGGNGIQYYDAAGVKVVKQSPDGFHRGRLTFNLNSKITRNISVSLYYMRQSEFNLFSDPYHTINVKNPVTGKVTRAYDDYNVAGLSLAFDFNLFKKQ